MALAGDEPEAKALAASPTETETKGRVNQEPVHRLFIYLLSN